MGREIVAESYDSENKPELNVIGPTWQYLRTQDQRKQVQKDVYSLSLPRSGL